MAYLIVATCHAETCRLPVFVGQVVNKIDEIWQQISRTRVFRTERNLARLKTEQSLLYTISKIDDFGARIPPEAPKFTSEYESKIWHHGSRFQAILWTLVQFFPPYTEGQKFRKRVSGTLRRSTMKVRSVRVLVIRHSLPEFGELWFADPAIPGGDMQQSFADRLHFVYSVNAILNGCMNSLISIEIVHPVDNIVNTANQCNSLAK